MTTPNMTSALGLGHPRAQSGARTELLVCIDLLDKGLIPYRAIGPHAPYDVIAADGPRLLRVECRTGNVYPGTGRLNYSKKGRETCDLFAVFNPASLRIEYFTPEGLPAVFD